MRESPPCPSLKKSCHQKQKKRKPFDFRFLVPFEVLLLNGFFDDLYRIWQLRYIIPDPEKVCYAISY